MLDLARYKEYLFSLKGTYESDPEISRVHQTSKLHYEERLNLLEKEIDGLMKKKINFTSQDIQGTRFLDYTTILHEKENQINELNRRIENFEHRLKDSKDHEQILQQ